ncbi:MAG: DUF4295 domain-containing protein [Flavobacteriales bacterium]|nr:DUF4295 domain-containing protein [Flavobacteriales bacterium]MCB9448061.1 DUF4295 domain-containing protein [Flavobacteriales bacterium]
MAKKTVATLKTGQGKDFTRVIKMVKSDKTGAYTFREEVVHNDHINDFLKGKDPAAETKEG